jgi:hypothetical protein
MIIDGLISECCNAFVRWLDCDECNSGGGVCELKVCVECGADVNEDQYEFTERVM